MFSSRHVRKNTSVSKSFQYKVLGNLTDLCLTSKWFLMISGNPSSKSLAPDQTDVCHKYMHIIKGIDF